MFGEILQRELPENLSNSAQDCLSRMTDAAARMEALIRALLAYSRVSSKKSPFKRIDLKEIAEKVNEDLEVSMGHKHPVVEIGDLPAIDGDPIQIAQLLQNLIVNAIRYSKDDQVPVVKISGRETYGKGEGKERWLELRVEDNGIGFDMCYLDKIFMPFERLHGRGRYEGTGMGLAICRKIAERHGGAITAQSRPGEGATFVVTLPMRQAVSEGEKNT
jgi:signal transduction histidine kinase